MLSNEVVRQVQECLDTTTLSHRAIARRVGVSRGTVQAIESGKRRIRDESPPKPEETAVVFSGPAVRCPGCGRKVHLPCMACRVASMPPCTTFATSEGETSLDLQGDHRRRYERIRRGRLEGEFDEEALGEPDTAAGVGCPPTIGEVLDAFDETDEETA